uniref:Uncharacterized protein n=1 Tax=Anguilla anguilla TaxID=7936 RepID=A0A0E9PW26_ANGAN
MKKLKSSHCTFLASFWLSIKGTFPTANQYSTCKGKRAPHSPIHSQT